MPKAAVIILNYNSSEDCRKCVSYLKRQQGVELELILIDNCSADADKVEILCQEQGCTFIASRENRGYNAGNNIGLRYAAEKGYEYAFVANPDMEFPQTDYMAKLIETMEKDSDIVVIGSDIVTPEGWHQNPLDFVSFWSEFLWPIDMLRCKFTKKTVSSSLDPAISRYCPMLSGCCIGLRIDFLKRLGFFDENVFLYCEEPILAYQVKKAGKKLYYLADTQALHRHIKSTKGNPYKRMALLCDSRNYKNKHHSDYNAFERSLLNASHKLRKWIMEILAERFQKANNRAKK